MTEPDTSARAVLLERARQLARPLAGIQQNHVTRESASQLLVATLGNERAGISLDSVIEVHRPRELTPIPGARAPVVGAIAWRGRVLTILDIAHTRQTPLAITDATRVLVLGQRGPAFGLFADDVEDVHDINTHDTAPVEDVSAERREFIRGVTADGLVVLDAAALIARFAPPQHSTGLRE